MGVQPASATTTQQGGTAPAARETVQLSLVLPCFNERDSVGPLMEEIDAVLRTLGMTSEVLFVNDCSTDDTAAVLAELGRKYPYLRTVHHSINCGESAAQSTGFREARGEIVVTMDSDQQNDPADIPELLKALEGVDAVCGVRRKRNDDWVKRLSSRIANKVRTAITGDPITDAGCTYRALRKSALGEVPAFNGMHRFLPTMMRRQGYAVIEILVDHRPRVAGKSKYGVGNRAFRGLVDCFAMRWYQRRSFPGRRVAGTAVRRGPGFEDVES